MVKNLQKYGNSHALVIDRALMDATGITPDTLLSITVHGDTLTIRPANVGVGPPGISDSLRRLRPQYAEMLKNLAK